MAQQKLKNLSGKELKLDNDEPSLLFAIQHLIANEGIDFDEWFTEWQALKQGRNTVLTSKQVKLEPVKPKFYDITPKDSKSRTKIIWYMPTGEESSGIALSGGSGALVEHIVQLEYEGGGNASSISGKNSKPPLAGLPAIKLVFMQDYRDVKAGDVAVKGEKLIRLVGYTADERIASMGLAEKLNKADVKKFAAQIVKVFFNYRWNKGQGTLSYSGLIARYQGLEGYAYSKTKTDGKELFTTMLKVFDKKPDELGFNWSESTSPAKKFSKVQPDEVVLGEKVKVPTKRPIATVIFDRAELILDKERYALVRQETVLYK